MTTRYLVVLALCMAVSGVEADTDRIKLTGLELAEQYSKYEVIAGLSSDSIGKFGVSVKSLGSAKSLGSV